MLYLAAPYTHDDPKVTEEWVRLTANAAAWLMIRGRHVVAPTVFGHALVRETKLDLPYDFWVDWGLNLLSRCDELYVLKVDGWEKSKGVQRELREAAAVGLPITHLRFDGEEWQITWQQEGNKKTIVASREGDYGPIEETAARFRAMTGTEDPLAYYRMMVYAKLARMEGKGNKTHVDSWEDIAEYANAAWKECVK